MRIRSTILALCVLAAPALAQTVTNTYAVFNRTIKKSTLKWVDPTDPLNTTKATSAKPTDSEVVVRNLTSNQELVFRLLLLPRRVGTGLQRYFKVETLQVDRWASVVFRDGPARGVRAPLEITNEEPDLTGREVYTGRNYTQRVSPLSQNTERLVFELIRGNEPTGGTPNPVFSHTQFSYGLKKLTPLLPSSQQSVEFPAVIVGGYTRWERQTHGVDPYRLLPLGLPQHRPALTQAHPIQPILSL
jgi:hypothetical protein